MGGAGELLLHRIWASSSSPPVTEPRARDDHVGLDCLGMWFVCCAIPATLSTDEGYDSLDHRGGRSNRLFWCNFTSPARPATRSVPLPSRLLLLLYRGLRNDVPDHVGASSFPRHYPPRMGDPKDRWHSRIKANRRHREVWVTTRPECADYKELAYLLAMWEGNYGT